MPDEAPPQRQPGETIDRYARRLLAWKNAQEARAAAADRTNEDAGG